MVYIVVCITVVFWGSSQDPTIANIGSTSGDPMDRWSVDRPDVGSDLGMAGRGNHPFAEHNAFHASVCVRKGKPAYGTIWGNAVLRSPQWSNNSH